MEHTCIKQSFFPIPCTHSQLGPGLHKEQNLCANQNLDPIMFSKVVWNIISELDHSTQQL